MSERSLKVIKQELYKKAVKNLSKKFKHIEADIEKLLSGINNKSDLGVELKSNIFKARVANSDKNRGKSPGYRLITYLKITDDELHLLYVYDKSSIENLTENEIDEIIINSIPSKMETA